MVQREEPRLHFTRNGGDGAADLGDVVFESEAMEAAVELACRVGRETTVMICSGRCRARTTSWAGRCASSAQRWCNENCRRISALLAVNHIHRRGEGRSTRYVHGPAPGRTHSARGVAPAGKPAEPARQFETPEGVVTIELSPIARDILDYVSRPAAARIPQGYQRRLLDDYVPNESAYIPDRIKTHLHEIGEPIVAERADGTFARDILRGSSRARVHRREPGRVRNVEPDRFRMRYRDALTQVVSQVVPGPKMDCYMVQLIGGPVEGRGARAACSSCLRA